MEDFLWGISGFLITVGLAIFADKIYPCIQKRILHKKVAACVSQNIGGHSSLGASIASIQYELQIPDQYKLTHSDENATNKIFRCYIRNLSLQFAKDELNHTRYITRMREEEYFMFSLHCYLKKHEADTSFADEPLYISESKKTINKLGWGYRTVYEEEGKLTEFGRTYVKLQLISLTYCQKNERINKDNDFHGCDGLKELLDTNEVSFSRYWQCGLPF